MYGDWLEGRILVVVACHEGGKEGCRGCQALSRTSLPGKQRHLYLCVRQNPSPHRYTHGTARTLAVLYHPSYMRATGLMLAGLTVLSHCHVHSLLHEIAPLHMAHRAGGHCSMSAQGSMPPCAQVVEQQLQALQQGEAGLRDCHMLMADAFHRRPDSMERFAAWFSSPLYEALLGCESWEYRGALATHKVPELTSLPEGHSVLSSVAVEQQVRVLVKPGRPKWAEAGYKDKSGDGVGHSLPASTFIWTLCRSSSDDDDSWRVVQIAPEAAPVFAPRMGHARFPRLHAVPEP